MAQLKKKGRKGSGPKETAPPPLNNPFAAQKKQLLELVAPAVPSLGKGISKTAQKPLPGPPEPKVPQVSDKDLFLMEMSGVSRIAPVKSGREQPVEQEREILVRQSEDAEAYAQLSDLVDGAGTFDISDTDEYVEGLAAGLDRRLLQRLRRGDYAIQAHVDLHGMVRDEARLQVEQFITESRLRGRRCVLIVHGRGLNSKDQIPVLKESVQIWLQRGRIGRAVLAFATARQVDGGAGAVYVLLRR